MKNVLFIVTEAESANGICCQAVMQEMKKHGIGVSCLTNREWRGQKTYLHNGIEHYAVRPRVTYRIESYLRRGECSGKKRRALVTLMQIINKSKLILSYFTWPLISPAYMKRVYKEAKHICKKHNIDTVIPIYTQIDTLIAANKLKKKAGIRYIPYFLDSFSGGYGPKIFSREWMIKRGIKWERKLLPDADLIIMMQSSKEHYLKYAKDEVYYDKIKFLDLPLFIPDEDKGEYCEGKGTIDLLYVGTIPTHIRNPKYFLDVFTSIEDERLRLTIIGTCTEQALIEEYAYKDKRINIKPFIEHNKAIEEMKRADVLINFGNNNPHMTPCKIFEYMSLGKPIISTAPIKDEPSLLYLDKYPNNYVLKEVEADIENDARNMHEFILIKNNVGVDTTALKKEYYLNTPEAFYDAVIAYEGHD